MRRCETTVARLTRLPGVLAVAEKLIWIPDARYPDGFFAATCPPSGRLADPAAVGDRRRRHDVRLDDVLGGHWTVLHIGARRRARPLGRAGAVPLAVPGLRLSADGSATRRHADPLAARKKAAAVVVRPDGFVYAAADSGQPLPPPRRFTLSHSRPDPNRRHRMTTTTLTEHTVTVAGKPIFVAEAGTGPAVVMLHGGGPGASGVSNYSRNIDALAEQFRVIVPDMPGYGRSAKGVDQDDPFGYLADMIRGLLDELGIDTAHLVGNSYGGAAALRLALDTPHRVDKLVLMGPGGIGTTRGTADGGTEEPAVVLRRRRAEPRQAGHVHPHLPRVRRRLGARRPDRHALRGHRSTPRWSPTRRCAGRPVRALRTLWRMDLTRDNRLKSLQTPTLVLWGRDDKVNRPAGGPMLVNLMPNAELVMTSHTGHWMQWERADLFNQLVTEFLSASRARTS